MRNLISILLIISMTLIFTNSRVNSLEKETVQINSQKINIEQYAKSYCNAKADHFFDGLENEKSLKYSYFRYVNSLDKNIITNEIYNNLMNQIRKNCQISTNEEKELNDYFIKEFNFTENNLEIKPQ